MHTGDSYNPIVFWIMRMSENNRWISIVDSGTFAP
jgi:hypothetical protein